MPIPIEWVCNCGLRVNYSVCPHPLRGLRCSMCGDAMLLYIGTNPGAEDSEKPTQIVNVP